MDRGTPHKTSDDSGSNTLRVVLLGILVVLLAAGVIALWVAG